MTKKVVTMFLVVLAFLWLAPQAQAQYMPYPYQATDRIGDARMRLLGMAWQSCNTPYPPSYCFEDSYGGYYPYQYNSYGRRYHRRGRGGLETIARVGIPIAAYMFGRHQGLDRGQRQGYEAGYENASNETADREERIREIRRQEVVEQESQELQEQEIDLVPMVNPTRWPVVIYDGNRMAGKLGPHEQKLFPAPKVGYRAVVRVVLVNRIQELPAQVRNNSTFTEWQVDFTPPEK